ncbi:S8 family serine peptidase [bacterium]|nr:S8 family serine peptidase [bacterium]
MLRIETRASHNVRGLLGTFAASGLTLLSMAVPASALNQAAGGPEYIPGRYIVILKEDAGKNLPAPAIEAMFKGPGVIAHHVFSHATKGFAGEFSDAALAAVKNDPRVAYVEQDQIVRIDQRKRPGGGGGGGSSSQIIPWGITRIGLGTPLAGPVNVDVAIIDTGIDTSHPDLTVVGGINYSGGASTSYSDGNGHGTHVAGTVAAKNNTIGVVGVAPGARLWSVRVLGSNGSGTMSAVIAGVDWVTANASTIEVANMSLGGGISSALNTAIDNAVAAGVTFAVAAGNSSTDTRGSSPANSTNTGVITVSALSSTGVFASFSNSGLNYADDSGSENGVDVIAPGVGIISTYMGGGYATLDGTSMASPHVAGTAALCKALNPTYSPADVKQAVMTSPPTGSWDVGPAGIFGLGTWRATSGDRDGFYEPLINAAAFAN